MLSDSLIILRKELKRIFTDRRMILFLVVLPLVMLPAMYSVMAKMDQARDSDIAGYRSSICIYPGQDNDAVIEPFVTALSGLNTHLEIIGSDEVESVMTAVAEKRKELLIVMPDDFGGRLSEYSTFDIGIYYNSTADYSEYAYQQAHEVFFQLSDEIVEERVAASGMPQDLLSVFTINQFVQRFDLASAGSIIGKVISILLPFFIIIYLFVNSMKVGLDSVAGEKERGTLAVLLVNQVDRLSIVVGKMLSVMVAAIVGAASSVIGLIIASRYFISMFGAAGSAMTSYRIGTLGILQFSVVTVPLAILVASIVLLVSTYARNTKEGQGMIMPVYFAVMIMGMATMQSGDVPPGWMQSTPIFNSLIALKSIFMHDATWSSIITASVTSMVVAAVLIYMTMRMFKNEKILFRI